MFSWRLYLLLVFVFPLPIGGVIEWSWPVYCALTSLLLYSELRCLYLQREQYQSSYTSVVSILKASRWAIAALFSVQIWVLIQSLSGISKAPFDTALYFIRGMGYSLFFVLTLVMLNNQQRIEQTLLVFLFAAVFQAIWGVFMVISGEELLLLGEKTSYLGLATGTFVNRNHFAGYLEMALALGIGYLISRSLEYKGNWRQRLRQFLQVLLSNKMLVRLGLIVMVIGLVMSRSRMGNTAFFSSMMITGIMALVLMKNRSLSTTILLSSLLVIDIAIVGTFFGVDKVVERIEKTSTDSERRDEFSRETFSMWQQVPVTGIGAGTFYYVFPAYKSKDLDTHFTPRHAHNDYAQFLAEFGAPATLILLCVVLASLWNAITAMRTRRSDFYKGLGFGSCMGIIAIGIHSTVDFNLQIPANAFMFMLLLALANIARYAPHESGSAVSGGHPARRHRS
jgi:O-antigen ligase